MPPSLENSNLSTLYTYTHTLHSLRRIVSHGLVSVCAHQAKKKKITWFPLRGSCLACIWFRMCKSMLKTLANLFFLPYCPLLTFHCIITQGQCFACLLLPALVGPLLLFSDITCNEWRIWVKCSRCSFKRFLLFQCALG